MKNRPTPPIADQLEKYSSAITLSDMEIFIFPELLYSLVLANILSPIVWSWREDPWFDGLERMTPYRRIMRLKQFIMDRFEFNLDLETWGLTRQETEIKRFEHLVDCETLSRSNALFGYEGDRYYFDIDIRRHFGLDQYDQSVIPYWKTETVEAMTAFARKPEYTRGAGECVSLSTLYAAALFVVCRIPLEDIFLMATPLHSQNFVLVREGILTNNRRIVTKNMWFNGTELTDKAQRALRNEQVTLVANNLGWLHTVYPEHTLPPESFRTFENHLKTFLTAEKLDREMISNFLRFHRTYQSCFQVRYLHHGKPHYIPIETLFRYEHSSPYKVGDNTCEKLIEEIDEDEMYPDPIESRICLERLCDFLDKEVQNPVDPADLERVAAMMDCTNRHTAEIMRALADFIQIHPRLPEPGPKQYHAEKPLLLTPEMTREELFTTLDALRTESATADLAFYAYRDLSRTDWAPFLKAALERNPVCIEAVTRWSDEKIVTHLDALSEESIYDGPRLAQPDEVWNFGCGDGLEKLILLANIRLHRGTDSALLLESDGARAILSSPDGWRKEVPTAKALTCQLELKR